MKIAFVRGQYLNNFELQSYYPLLEDKKFELTGFSSLKPIHNTFIPIKKFASPVDLPDFPYKLPILNRVLIDSMYLLGMEKELKDYDIAHVRETYFHFSRQAIEAKKMGYIKKVLVTCSETIPFNHESIWGRHWLKQQVINGADHFHCLTNKAKLCLISEGVTPDKLTVIPYGVDLTKFKPQDNQKDGGKINILFVGRLEEQKGIHELMEAWDQIRKNFDNVNLKIVGKGPLESLAKNSGLTPTHYSYNQMSEVLRSADILVLPSKPTRYWEEYFGMVLIEAMATGLPIMTTNCGAIPEVVGDAAVVVNHSNSKDLYEGLRKMIENNNLRLKLREEGLKRAKTYFDTQKQAKKLGELYKNVIK